MIKGQTEALFAVFKFRGRLLAHGTELRFSFKLPQALPLDQILENHRPSHHGRVGPAQRPVVETYAGRDHIPQRVMPGDFVPGGQVLTGVQACQRKQRMDCVQAVPD
ncbi:hypothetical protein AHiyo4_11960 [Arthrobacter sp. Hiyo4]|nr:hypothetical protein AHiyo4_11960 [Arthrobacter sp. Hiyo4]